MGMEEICIGEHYFCSPIGYTGEISGEVVKKLDHCAIVRVEVCSLEDETINREKVGMALACYQTFQVAEAVK